jgi:AcrR family transcriptional regulator
MARKYTLKKRAELQEETRRRIVEAAVALHESVGDAGATVTAIAERAGVGRPTFYRHFPDEQALFKACTRHYFMLHPPPDPATWAAIADPLARLDTALAELYAYYHETEGMLSRAEQDASSNPALGEALAPYAVLWIQMRDCLLAGMAQQGETGPLLTAAVGHALAFSTWRSLVREQQLNDEQAIDVMTAMVRGLSCCPASFTAD